jgi:hypothetical protein
MLALYRGLLYLYPLGYRHEFAGEMTSVFREAKQAVGNEGFIARVSFCAREIGGLLSGALRQHFRSITGSEIPFRRFAMRPQFRFPRSTVFLMLVIFAGVTLTIAKASSIQVKYGAIGSVWPSLLSTLAFMVLTMWAVAVIVWGILFALRRTGMHRLANVQTWSESGPSGITREP